MTSKQAQGVGTESLTLKWGTLKGWKLESEAAQAIMQQYIDLGSAVSAMQQRDTPEQKQLICDLIDAVDGEIHDDWNGGTMTKDEAKKYVMEYGQPRPATLSPEAT